MAKKNYILGDTMVKIKELRPGEYHFAEVDPPYCIKLDITKSRRQKKVNQTVQDYKEWSAEGYAEALQEIASEVYRVLYKDSFAIFWHGADWYNEVLEALQRAGFHTYTIAGIWYKGDQGETANPDQQLANCYEQFLIGRKGDPKLAKSGRSNVFRFSPVPGLKKMHPTEKPVELYQELLETFTWPGSKCVVPFLGSGNTLRGAYKTGRIAFGWDLSEEYRDKFLGRIAEEEMSK